MAGLTAFKPQFFDALGNPLVGGKLYSYQAGTTTPLATYTDATGSTPNTNPVILDARGEASVWLAGSAYKFSLKDPADVAIWTLDNVQGPTTPTVESSDGIFSWSNAAVGQIWQFQPGAAYTAFPRNVRWILRCVSAGDGAYVAGDRIDVTYTNVGNTMHAISGGLSTFYFAQNGVLSVKDKAVAASSVTLTAARWDLKCIVEF